MYNNAFNIIGGMLGAAGIAVILFAVLICIAVYVATAYPLFVILKEVGYEYAWLAWIPICQYFTIVMAFNAKDDPNLTIAGIEIPRPLAGFAGVIAGVLGNIPFIGFIFPILAVIVNGFILAEMYDVCEDSEPGQNTAMGIISALVGIVAIIMFWKYMGKANRGEINLANYTAHH